MDSITLCLRRFWLLNYLLVLTLLLFMAGVAPFDIVGIFVLLASLGYALLFLLPGLLLAWGLRRLGGNLLAIVTAIIASSLVLFLLYADAQLFAMYGFHFNGFVWNLITTPGGIAALDSSQSTYVTVGLGLTAIVVAELFLWFLVWKFSVPKQHVSRWWRWALVTIVLSMVAERAIFGISHFTSYRPVLTAAHSIPFYRPTTFASFLKSLGFSPVRHHQFKVAGKGRLQYPLKPLSLKADAPRPNIVILACESLRWDMLTPEIMPNLWAFAEKNQRFTNHYSGGDGTRMGVFSLFYGVPPSYWFAFLDQRQPPVLVTTLQQQGYAFGLYTSAKFTYPEFDRTIWASIPAELLHSDDEGPGWKNDHENVTRLNRFINDSQRNATPFLGFMFFESTHARYFFPDDAVIRPDYLRDFNYATVDVAANIDGIKARYINSSHALDREIGRVLDNLAAQKLLDNTLVVITGDHGEEFMEKGRWGHNSAFHNEQIHVPMVLHVPGKQPAVIDQPTSHLDLVPTLMPLLGVTNEPEDYSAAAVSLLTPTNARYRVVGSWSAVGYISNNYKISMPMGVGGVGYTQVTGANDEPVENDAAVMAQEQSELFGLLNDLSTFYRRTR